MKKINLSVVVTLACLVLAFIHGTQFICNSDFQLSFFNGLTGLIFLVVGAWALTTNWEDNKSSLEFE